VDRDPLADERVGGDLAALPDLRVLLDLDKGPHLAPVADLAAIEVYEPKDLHAAPELDVGRDPGELGTRSPRVPGRGHTAILAPPAVSDFCAASSIRTTLSPAIPLDQGILLKRTHSRKCSHST